MNRLYQLFCILFIVNFYPSKLSAQEVGTTSRSGFLVGIDYNFQVPLGDLADRFGNNFTIGVGLIYKTKNNWLLGAKMDYIFGREVKEDSLFSNLLDANEQLVGTNGNIAKIVLFERGFHPSLKIGKLFPLSDYKNSGIYAMIGGGFLQHKIRIIDRDDNLPQLSDDYLKGYDRLANGWALSQSVGYLYMDNGGLLNFYGGFEFVQAFTQGRRDFLFDVGRADKDKRMDIFIGVKLGWIIPFLSKHNDEYYYR